MVNWAIEYLSAWLFERLAPDGKQREKIERAHRLVHRSRMEQSSWPQTVGFGMRALPALQTVAFTPTFHCNPTERCWAVTAIHFPACRAVCGPLLKSGKFSF